MVGEIDLGFWNCACRNSYPRRVQKLRRIGSKFCVGLQNALSVFTPESTEQEAMDHCGAGERHVQGFSTTGNSMKLASPGA